MKRDQRAEIRLGLLTLGAGAVVTYALYWSGAA